MKNKQSTFNNKNTTSSVVCLIEEQFRSPRKKYIRNGTHINTDGDRFVGEYKNGKLNGKGKMFAEDGSTYVGEFKDGKFSGKGVFEFSFDQRYEGDFKDGNQHGCGVTQFPSGDFHDGEYKNGVPNGEGVQVEGSEINVGQFKDGMFHGKGYRIDGSVVTTGLWKEGSLLRGEQWVRWNSEKVFRKVLVNKKNYKKRKIKVLLQIVGYDK